MSRNLLNFLIVCFNLWIPARSDDDGPPLQVRQGSNVKLGEALQFLREYDTEASNMCFRVSSAQWAYSTNMTDYNKRRMIEEQTLKAKFDKVTWRKAMEFDWARIPDPMARRQLGMLVKKNRASLPEDKYNEIYHLVAEMKDLYTNVKICPFIPNEQKTDQVYCDLELMDAQKLMTKSANHLELLHVWEEWHDKTGPPMRNKFMRYVDLANQAAQLNGGNYIKGINSLACQGFGNAGEEMGSIYEADDFQDELAETFQKILPLYKQLFAYVRSKLHKHYGPDVVRPNGPLPAHILGNLWAQEWSKIYHIVAPYPEFGNIDVTDELLQQGFTPLRQFFTNDRGVLHINGAQADAARVLEVFNDRKTQLPKGAMHGQRMGFLQQSRLPDQTVH
ncbi:hypothetical protein D910_09734 [Dendroctonus ponderosae]|uniref:Angiotensin-converting enzyme n=1 Tax=Dendroctonus ponderosae TaxID=77166 RepID=U4UQU2_DENPD|nr:hypothetical protein D910_09734 [Dendroctonus ponderosae]